LARFIGNGRERLADTLFGEAGKHLAFRFSFQRSGGCLLQVPENLNEKEKEKVK
jgi:hypothetical protein